MSFTGCINPVPLGMKDGMIQDNQISASSVYSAGLVAHEARLDGSACWAAKTNDGNQWIQVTFDTPIHITGVITQGCASYSEWVTTYKVDFSNDGVTWQYVKDIQGNDKVSLNENITLGI